jgi:hypothetical protein
VELSDEEGWRSERGDWEGEEVILDMMRLKVSIMFSKSVSLNSLT